MAEITPEKLQRMLNDKSFIDELSKLQIDVNNKIAEVAALNGSSLGGTANESINGVKSLVSSVDYPDVGGQNVAPTLATINPSEIPGLEDDSALAASEIITLAAPAAISAVLPTVTPNATPSVLNNINNGITSDQFKDAYQRVSSVTLDKLLSDAGGTVQSQINASKDKVSIDLGGLLTSIVETSSKDLFNAVEQLGKNNLTTTEINNIVVLTKDKNYFDAIAILKSKVPDLDETAAQTSLQALKITTTDKIKTPATPGVLSRPKQLGEAPDYVAGQKPSGKLGWGETFTYIGSYSELEADLNAIVRPVTEMIIHWTETTTDRDIGSVEIEEATTLGIPFHYVIRRDGSIQRGRPVEYEIDHAGDHHKRYSISVALVGGINSTVKSGTGTINNISEYYSSKSFSDRQWNSFDNISKAFYTIFPGGQILGHNDVDLNAIDPGFNVIDYMRQKYGKESIFTDLPDEPSYSPADIVKLTGAV